MKHSQKSPKKPQAPDTQTEFEFVSPFIWSTVPTGVPGQFTISITKIPLPKCELSTRQFAQCFVAGRVVKERDVARVRDWIASGIIRLEERKKVGPKLWVIDARAVSRLKREWKMGDVC